MTRKTLDAMLAELQQLKNDGVPGDTPMGVAVTDNNGKGGFVRLDIRPYFSRVAKDEADKNWAVCRTVSRGGKQVIVVG